MFFKYYNENFKSQTSYTNTSYSKEETIHSNSHPIGLPSDRTTVRTDCQPNGQPSDRTTVRSTSCPTLQHLFSVLRVAYRYAIKLFRLTLLSSAPFNPSINRCEYTRSLFAFSTFGCYIRYLYQNTIDHTTQTI